MPYLELAALGKNQWWRYLLGVLLIAFMWQVVGAIPLASLMFMVTGDGNPDTSFNAATMRFTGVDPLVSYLAISFTFVALLAGVFLAIRLLHQRGFLTLVTAQGRMDWKRYFQGFAVYFSLVLGLTLLSALASPDQISISFDPGRFFLFLPFALLLTPLQACAEELVFRGYVMQGLRRLFSNPLLIAVLSGILFMLPHLLNPEAGLDPLLMPLTYFMLGLFLALVTLRDNSLELAMGAHSANNVYAFVFVNYEGSVLESPSLLTESAPDPLASLLSVMVIALLFYWIVFRLLPAKQVAKA